jgi:hypothetical protein
VPISWTACRFGSRRPWLLCRHCEPSARNSPQGRIHEPRLDPRWTAHIIRTQRSFSEVDRLSIALLEIRPTSFEGMSRHAADVLDELIIKA